MTETLITFFEPIEKEEIHFLEFPKIDVLEEKKLKRERIAGLARGLALGNINQLKIEIFFEDNQSKKVVKTTVWDITDDKVILKKGTFIPINRIYYSQ
jgi:hypothetical protein